MFNIPQYRRRGKASSNKWILGNKWAGTHANKILLLTRISENRFIYFLDSYLISAIISAISKLRRLIFRLPLSICEWDPLQIQRIFIVLLVVSGSCWLLTIKMVRDQRVCYFVNIKIVFRRMKCLVSQRIPLWAPYTSYNLCPIFVWLIISSLELQLFSSSNLFKFGNRK